MRSCDDCAGGEACAGIRLTPVLLRVLDLYAGGTTDKFEILFALDAGDEALLEAHAANVRRECWTRAALGAIAEALLRDGSAEGTDGAPDPGDRTARLEHTLATARDAFARFPWRLPDLVDQAPALHAHVCDRSTGDAGFGAQVTKRAFAKACRKVVYGRE